MDDNGHDWPALQSCRVQGIAPALADQIASIAQGQDDGIAITMKGGNQRMQVSILNAPPSEFKEYAVSAKRMMTKAGISDADVSVQLQPEAAQRRVGAAEQPGRSEHLSFVPPIGKEPVMTLMRETPKDHGLLLDHDPKGNRRLSVTLAGKSPRKNGRRLQSATGKLYNRCLQHVSTILWNHHGVRLQPQEEAARQYHSITEEAAVQIRLLMDAVAGTERAEKAENLARAVADLHPCESSWWYACHKNRNRPSQGAGSHDPHVCLSHHRNMVVTSATE